MSKKRSEQPSLWIIAGPNGSGKTTLYEKVLTRSKRRAFWIINPDLLARKIQTAEKLTLLRANIEAVKRIETWLETSVEAYQTIGVETVLSTAKYRKLVLRAKRKGFMVRLLYVMLDDVEINVLRVRLRVKKKGHGVPDEKVRDRHDRSLRQLPWFLHQASEAFLYNNSGNRPIRMADKIGDTITTYDEAMLPEMQKIIDKVGRMRPRKSIRPRKRQ